MAIQETTPPHSVLIGYKELAVLAVILLLIVVAIFGTTMWAISRTLRRFEKTYRRSAGVWMQALQELARNCSPCVRTSATSTTKQPESRPSWSSNAGARRRPTHLDAA